MELVLNGMQAFANWIWGIPMLLWIVGGGLMMSLRLGFLQFTKLGFILKNTIGKSMGKKGENGKFSGWQAVTGALASTLGAGNIIGTAMAIALGGPGGVFWLWLSGFFCCIVKYCETTIAMKYRKMGPKKIWEGGPQIYLSAATGWKWLSPLYAILVICGLFLASSAQIGSGVDNLVKMGTPRLGTTVILTLLVGLVVIGGIKSLLTVTEKLVPFMSVLYMVGCIIVIAMNINHLPAAILLIFKDAFTGHAAFGGFVGATITQSIRWGIARGCYSNAAGTGVATILHAVADVNHPVQQSMWAVFEVFFDTIVVCSMTCLVILTSGIWTEKLDPAIMTATAFEQSMGTLGGILATIAVVLFTFTTACAQITFTEAQIVSLVGEKYRKIGRYGMVLLLLLGGTVGISALIPYIDFFTGLYTFFNMLGVYWCGSMIVSLTKEYFADPLRWETEKWPA
ncbi:amino acid carrier protein [Acidaminococcus fermentans]|uniref:alanine/glycine:cation symporter family protein n=1 Tax=Acidaminococcus fermentans TaxID=905 RepID=UPI002432B13C|nr:amino acid carrier protein [Acidaminococcus fermentans]